MDRCLFSKDLRNTDLRIPRVGVKSQPGGFLFSVGLSTYGTTDERGYTRIAEEDCPVIPTDKHSAKGNIYSDVPDRLPEEIMETLVSSGKVRIQRIISYSHASPEGFWYDQDENEWVLLTKGSAALKFDGKEELLLLRPGDWVDIPAHVRHRVEWTDPEDKTVWVGVFY